MSECFDFPLMVVHKDGCPYTKGGICFPRPGREAPEETVQEYLSAVEFYRGGARESEDGRFKRHPKPGGVSIDEDGELSW